MWLAPTCLSSFISSPSLSRTSLSQPGALARQRIPWLQFRHLTCTLLFPLLGTLFPHISPGSLPHSDIFLSCHLLILTPNDQCLSCSPYRSVAPHWSLTSLFSVIFLPNLKASRHTCVYCSCWYYSSFSLEYVFYEGRDFLAFKSLSSVPRIVPSTQSVLKN